MGKQIEETGKMMSQQIKDIIKEIIEIIKRKPKEILSLTAITEMKNSVVDFNSIIEKAEERISKFENRSIVAIQFEENKEKKRKRDVLETSRIPKMHHGSPKRRGDIEKEVERLFEVIMVKTS